MNIAADPSPSDWMPQGSLLKLWTRGDLSLGITLLYRSDGRWHAFAVETPGSSVDEVLAQHSHKFLPPSDELGIAMDRAEVYALAWIAGEAFGTACTCPEIATP